MTTDDILRMARVAGIGIPTTKAARAETLFKLRRFFQIAQAAAREECATLAGWTPLSQRMPNPDQHQRVLIYTEGYEFNGEQVFDVQAETLNECFYADPDDQPEVCRVATHWMPHPANAALSKENSND